MRLRAHEAIIACPRIIGGGGPDLTDAPCEADLLAAVHGQRPDELWLEYHASCHHELTLAEEGRVLAEAIEELDRRYYEEHDR